MHIQGSFTAKKCVKMLTQQLHQYNISLKKDIVDVTTDEPNTMLKIGKEIEHQLCLTCDIHLAICDALYYNKQNSM